MSLIDSKALGANPPHRAPKLQQQVERIRSLTKAQQRLVRQAIDTLLAYQSR